MVEGATRWQQRCGWCCRCMTLIRTVRARSRFRQRCCTTVCWVTTPAFALYALANGNDLHAQIAYTRLQKIADVEVRSMIPGQSFRSRLPGALYDGGECYVSSAGELHFLSAVSAAGKRTDCGVVPGEREGHCARPRYRTALHPTMWELTTAGGAGYRG